jgi:hypothetical protein
MSCPGTSHHRSTILRHAQELCHIGQYDWRSTSGAHLREVGTEGDVDCLVAEEQGYSLRHWTVINQIEPMAAPYKPLTASDLPAGVPLSVGGWVIRRERPAVFDCAVADPGQLRDDR